VDRENIKASYKDGVLKVVLPKKEEVKPKQIRIDDGQA
jgi:HSP20 family molecular chaperone IbpA